MCMYVVVILQKIEYGPQPKVVKTVNAGSWLVLPPWFTDASRFQPRLTEVPLDQRGKPARFVQRGKKKRYFEVQKWCISKNW